uniref:Uncharacterized protein n=1 Tax=viral metagenome TaxID=1070528 RepID=A0A6M3MB37_9ZZZZ
MAQWIPKARCVKCGKEYPTYELLYDGVEPDVHSPMCRWCIIKDAQERFGVENVRLGNEN